MFIQLNPIFGTCAAALLILVASWLPLSGDHNHVDYTPHRLTDAYRAPHSHSAPETVSRPAVWSKLHRFL